MERDHDKRARRPPASKSEPEGLDNAGAEGKDLNLRAGRPKQELGRNPRGEPVSVNEMLARYKQAQARKFAVHGANNRQDAPADTPSSMAPDIVAGPEVLPGMAATSKEPPPLDFRPEPAPPVRNTYSHEHESRSNQDRQGIFRHDKVQTTKNLIDAARKRNTQRDSERFILSAEARSEAAVASPTADDAVRVQTVGKLMFSEEETLPPVDSDTPIPEGDEEQPLEPFLSEDLEELPHAADGLSETKTPLLDSLLSHTHKSAMTHERQGLLLHDVASAVPAAQPQRRREPHDTSASVAGTAAPADAKNSTVNTADGAHESPPQKKPGKLKFEGTDGTSEGKKSGDKLDGALSKAERSSEKLTIARENLPKKRSLRMNREFDAEKGRLKPRLRFEEGVKTRAEHLKGSPVTRPVKLSAGAAVNYTHTKVFQVENDNVAVKAAHRGELIAEHGARAAYRHHKTAPYRKVEKLERRTVKLNAKAAYRQSLHDNPELAKKPVSQIIQKRRIKRQYAKAARDSKRAGGQAATAAKKTGIVAQKTTAAVKKAASNPKVLLVAGLLFFIVILMFGVISSCSNMASGISSSVVAMSYMASDADVDAAELYYTELETDMRLLVANTETDHAGYDEYRYYIDGVGHDPFALMAFLSAVYHDFTFADMQPVLDSIFAEQYRLEFTPSVEIRTHTETHTSSYTDPVTGETSSDEYEVEVEYEWHILTVTLTSQPLSSVITLRMDADQTEHYALLMQSKGLRQYAASPFPFDWLPYVSSYYGYRVHPITGVKNYHLGIDIALPTGTEIIAAQSGTVTFAGDSGGYGYVVVIEDGEGLVTKYAHCDTLLVGAGQTVTVGDAIATVGNTGNSTGPHLHFEVLKDDSYLNPIYFALTGS